MRYIVVITLVFLSIGFASAQEVPKREPRIPLMVGLNFQNFALPFTDLKSNFSHPGLSIGSELRINKKGSLLQQLQAAVYRNKEAGNGFMIFTQFCYRQKIYKGIFTEIKAGPGWQRVYHPSQAYHFNDGKWEKTVGGKSQLIIPLGLTVGYSPSSLGSNLSPFLTMQMVPAFFYNDVIPLNTYTMIQAGILINLKN